MVSPAVGRIILSGRRYVGPGDVVGSALAWASPARAYSAAFAASRAPIMELVDTATGLITTIVNIRRNGFADLSAIPAYGCSVKTLYDQSGTGNHFSQATLANMPILTRSSLNGLPGLTFSGSMVLATSGNVTPSQPFSFSSVAVRTNTSTAALIGCGSVPVQLGYPGSANLAQISCGTALTAAASDSAYHALQGVANGASSIIVVDGAATTGNGGTTAASTLLRIGRSNGGNTLAGTIMEAGMWPVGFDATQYGSMNANQHGINGYSF